MIRKYHITCPTSVTGEVVQMTLHDVFFVPTTFSLQTNLLEPVKTEMLLLESTKRFMLAPLLLEGANRRRVRGAPRGRSGKKKARFRDPGEGARESRVPEVINRERKVTDLIIFLKSLNLANVMAEEGA